MSEKEHVQSATFKEFEHLGWQTVAGPYHDYFSNLTGQTIDSLLDAVDLGSGMSLLDIASGPGYVAAAAAGRGATVTAVDFSSVMVETASNFYPAIEFIEGDAEALPFDSDRFDTAVMNFGLLHLDRPEQALAEARRVVKQGGRFAFTVWVAPSESIGFSIALSAVEEHGNPRVSLPPGPPFFRFSDPAESEREMERAGFEKTFIRKLPMVWQLDSREDLFKAFYDGTPRTGGLLHAQTSEDLEGIKSAVTGQAQRYETQEGLRIPMAALVVSGVKR